MKLVLNFLILLLINLPIQADFSESYPILDVSSPNILPRYLRLLEGYPYTGISGSGQFSAQTFEEMKEQLRISPENLVLFDLREESHGFVNGIGVSWTDGNYNHLNCFKTLAEIEREEKTLLEAAKQKGQIYLQALEETTILDVYEVQTEREFIESLGACYIRLPVTDHYYPSDQILDQFILFMKQIQPNQWVHLHCKGGKSRTTTFLALIDMMLHANQSSLEEILNRQQFIGGVNLREINKKDEIRIKGAYERLELIKRFYLYCREVPDFSINWSAWSQKQSQRDKR